MSKTVLIRRAALAAVLFVTLAGPAPAHLIRSDGLFTYRYLSRAANAQPATCVNGTNGIDPLNVVYYQYGDVSRIHNHIEPETHLGNFTGHSADQVVCGMNDSFNPAPQPYGDIQQEFSEQQGHGSICCSTVRAHIREWSNPHAHSTVDTWSTIDAHHERLTCCPGHQIDEPWQTWEYHVAAGDDMDVAHNVWIDHYRYQGTTVIQGFSDNGYITRVGGLHNGGY